MNPIAHAPSEAASSASSSRVMPQTLTCISALEELAEAGELAAGGLDVRRAHQGLADQHGVDADALEVVELVAGAEAGLRDDRLARRDVREQLEGALDVDGEVAEVAVVDAE